MIMVLGHGRVIEMIYSIRGKVAGKHEGFFVIQSGGLGFKIFTNKKTLALLPTDGKEAPVFTYLHVREDRLDLFGFLKEEELVFFQTLNSVSGVGPKMALQIIDAYGAARVSAAIGGGDAAFLSKIPGVGKKTAERLILELKNKVVLPKSGKASKFSQVDDDVEEVLVGLGYQRRAAREAVDKIGTVSQGFEERLKKAIRIVSGG